MKVYTVTVFEQIEYTSNEVFPCTTVFATEAAARAHIRADWKSGYDEIRADIEADDLDEDSLPNELEESEDRRTYTMTNGDEITTWIITEAEFKQ